MAAIVVGITGASGIVLAHKAVQALVHLGHTVHLVMTRDSHITTVEEMGIDYGSAEKFVSSIPFSERIVYHKINDFTASIASGSFHTDGMLIIPCTMGTLAAVTIGLADNLLRRAADVTLKERRRLVLVPRETPFSDIHLNNMLTLSRMGTIIVPPIPAWYTKPKTLQDVEDFIVGRALDALGIDANLYPRWGK